MKFVFLICTLLFFGSSHAQTVSKKDLAKRLHGYWLGEDYLKTIEKSKSIFNSFGNNPYKTEVWGFILDSANLLADSAYLNGFSTHEGGYGSFLIFNPKTNTFHNNPSKNQEYSHFYMKDFNLVSEQNLLTMYFPKSGKRDVFRKVIDEQVELRRILFNKSFSDQQGKRVTFSANGSLSGFKNFTYFEVVYDFNDESLFDAIYCYTSGRKSSAVFKYEFKGNALHLYEVSTNPDSL